MEALPLVTVAAVVLAYGLVSRKLEGTVVSGPMVFVTAGVVLGGGALGVMDFEQGAHTLHTFAEATLILVLFIDAAGADLKQLRRDYALPLRLLAVGMPLTIGLGILAAIGVLPWLGVWGAALIAAILAPTDAALGQAVVTDTRVPARMRGTLNVESGLNDGIALPVVLILAACTEAAGQAHLAPWVDFTAKQLILGPLAGIAVGWLGGKLIERAVRGGWMGESFELLAGLASAFLAYGLAELVGGNGFIAAFVGGLALGRAVERRCEGLLRFAEAEGQLLELVTFLFFGAVLVPEALRHATPAMWLYAGLSLTVVRMLPVSLSLIGAGLRPVTHLFLGWFGPRGLASILFGLLILDRLAIDNREPMLTVVVLTVLLSVFAHGITAVPAARAYARFMRARQDRDQLPEHMTEG